MTLGKTGRKRTRPGSGFNRLAQDVAPRSSSKRWERLAIGTAFLVIVAALTRLPKSDNALFGQDIDSQSIAQETIRTEFYFESEEVEATREKRDQAAADVPDTYRVDRQRVRKQLDLLTQRIQALSTQQTALDAALRKALLASTSEDEAGDVVSKTVLDFAEALRAEPAFEGFPDATFLAVWLTPAPESLPEREFAPPEADSADAAAAEQPRPVTALRDAPSGAIVFTCADQVAALATDGLEYVLNQGIIGPSSSNNTERKVVILREDPLADQTVTDELAFRDVPAPEAALESLRMRIVDKAKLAANQQPERSVDWAKLHGAAFEMAKPGIIDTLFFDRVNTEGGRERIWAAVEPVKKEIHPGEIIQRAGERWTNQSRADVKTYWEALKTGREPSARVFSTILAHMIFAGLALICLHKAVPLLAPRRSSTSFEAGEDLFRPFALVLLVMCSTLIAGRAVYYFEPTGLVLPVTASAMLLAILVHARLAAMVSFLTVTLVSIQYGYDWRLLILGVAMSLASVFSIFAVRRRSDITRAALQATVVGVVTMAAITLATDSLFTDAAFRRLGLVAMNGAMCLLIVPGLLAPLERLFRVTTDIQLLEYSDLNNEVLARLAIEIPATYAHSLMLGQLAEAACDAIGANGLLARVCAYYHDIGKMRRPQYFSENQNGVNIHDELSPRHSARAIASHVTQGVELAREYHLPQPIVNGIQEHHGTSLISFFYHQAVEQQKHGDVVEEDFRYPGPKPQSRETAILMICDAVESGVRSLKNPNEERVKEFVSKIVASRSADRQFDDCHLTLKELDTVSDVVARRVLSMLHTRVAYPDAVPPAERKPNNVIPLSGGME
ncbi:MAG: hypothetical protein QG656_243 [Candidatus Hydrogenedentes bacterium]|nr:hypothetical protein [Candidatus Hydrogenedentota bacterium]